MRRERRWIKRLGDTCPGDIIDYSYRINQLVNLGSSGNRVRLAGVKEFVGYCLK